MPSLGNVCDMSVSPVSLHPPAPAPPRFDTGLGSCRKRPRRHQVPRRHRTWLAAGAQSGQRLEMLGREMWEMLGREMLGTHASL